MSNEVVKKPLSRDDQRALKALIKGDYENLQSEFITQVNQKLNEETEEVKSQYDVSDEKKVEASRKVRELGERFRREYEDLLAEIKAQDNLVLASSHRNDYTINLPASFVVSGRQDALAKVQAKWTAIQRKGISSLSQQENNAQRQLIVSNIDSEARSVLDGLPDSSEVVAKAISAFQADNPPQLTSE